MAQRLLNGMNALGLRQNSLKRLDSLNTVRCFGNEPGELGSGEGKGGGGGGSVRSAGGAFGRMEVAREEEYFYKQQKKQLAMLRKTLDEEVASHKKHIEIHQDAIERHKQKIAELVKEEKKLETFEK